VTAKVGALLSRQAFNDFRRRLDYTEYGGAPLLGVRGVTVIGHGRSNANAIKNAIRVANELAGANLTEKIEQELSIPAVRQHAQAGAAV
jgi:glycerol-3-phosphate acyltransferase PlsX